MAAIGFEQLTVAASSVSLTAATFGTANRAKIHCETAAVRFRVDATAPTASVGDFLEPGDILELTDADELNRARFIRRDGTSATLNCHYLLDD